MEPFITPAETRWELRVTLLLQPWKEGKHSSFASVEEGPLCSLSCPSQAPLELPKGLFGSTEAFGLFNTEGPFFFFTNNVLILAGIEKCFIHYNCLAVA